MLAPVTHIVPLTSIRRARLLPTKGRVLAKVGQRVNTMDVVAETTLEARHILLDVRSSLGIRDPRQARRLIERKVGEQVQEGDIIAVSGSLIQRVLRAPVDGQIVSIIGGQVLLEVAGSPYLLRAGMPGEVIEIIQDRGVLLQTSGVLIQGVWGNRRISRGKLKVLARSPNEELTANQLDLDKRGLVLVSGYCTQPEALKAASELPINGLILGSMSSNLIPLANRMKLPIILTEGFGKHPMNTPAYKLLKTNEERDISLNAVLWDTDSGERPEMVIELPAFGNAVAETDIFKPEQLVRIHAVPHIGKTGTILRILPGLSRLSTGVLAPAAEVLLENNETLLVPLANLDVIE